MICICIDGRIDVRYMRRMRNPLLAAFVSVVLVAAGLCSSASAQAPKKVVTSFTILADMAANVGGDRIVVESITKPGAEIHNYQPTPGDILRAQGAELVLWNGLNLEQWFERFLRTLRGVPSAVLSEGIQPLGIREGPYEGKPNPHAWMSPADALIYVENIRKALTELDPEGAAIYEANAKAYSAKIEAVGEPFRRPLRRSRTTVAGSPRARGIRIPGPGFRLA